MASSTLQSPIIPRIRNGTLNGWRFRANVETSEQISVFIEYELADAHKAQNPKQIGLTKSTLCRYPQPQVRSNHGPDGVAPVYSPTNSGGLWPALIDPNLNTSPGIKSTPMERGNQST